MEMVFSVWSCLLCSSTWLTLSFQLMIVVHYLTWSWLHEVCHALWYWWNQSEHLVGIFLCPINLRFLHCYSCKSCSLSISFVWDLPQYFQTIKNIVGAELKICHTRALVFGSLVFLWTNHDASLFFVFS